MTRRWIVTCALFLCGLAWAAGYDLSSVMSGILKTESGGNQFAIFDNTTHKSYSMPSRSEAERMANYLISLNHNIDMGLYQVNSIHLSRGWSVSNLFDGAFNRQAAETIFNEWLTRAKTVFGDTQLAWERAIGAYNAGTIGLKNGNPTYVNKVLRAMGAGNPAIDREDIATATPRLPPSAKLSTGIAAFDDEEDDAEGLEPPRTVGDDNVVDVLIMQGIATVTILILLVLGVKVFGTWFIRILVGQVAKGVRSATKRARAAVESI